MGVFEDIAKAGYGAARTASKIGSVSNDVGNILNGRVDRVARKHMKKVVFKNVNKALNAGSKLFNL